MTNLKLTLNSEMLKRFPLRSGTDKDIHSHHFIHTVLAILAKAIREEKEIQGI